MAASREVVADPRYEPEVLRNAGDVLVARREFIWTSNFLVPFFLLLFGVPGTWRESEPPDTSPVACVHARKKRKMDEEVSKPTLCGSPLSPQCREIPAGKECSGVMGVRVWSEVSGFVWASIWWFGGTCLLTRPRLASHFLL